MKSLMNSSLMHVSSEELLQNFQVRRDQPGVYSSEIVGQPQFPQSNSFQGTQL